MNRSGVLRTPEVFEAVKAALDTIVPTIEFFIQHSGFALVALCGNVRLVQPDGDRTSEQRVAVISFVGSKGCRA